MATYHKAHIAKFNKDIKAALAARATKLGYQAVANMSNEHLEQQLIELMNEDAFQDRFETQEDFTPYFKAAFKKEMLAVAKFREVAPEVVEYLGALPAEEEVQEAVATEAAAEEAAPVMQVLPSEPEALPADFLVVELRPEAAVAVPFNDVESARKYAKRRNKEGILSQPVTADQYRERGNPESMVAKFNLLDKPYLIGEYVEPQMKVNKAAEATAAPEAAPTTPEAAVAPEAAPAKAKKATTPKATTPKAAPADAVLLPSPKRVLRPVPEGAPVTEVLQAKLANLQTVDELNALLTEAEAAGHKLVIKAYNKPVTLLSHNPSEKYDQVFCLQFAYPENPTKQVSKAYLHALPKYYHLAPAA
jgi:hypothetical protein